MKALAFLTSIHFLLLCTSGALAVAEKEIATSEPQVWEWFQKGGLLMYPIALCSLLSLAIVLERLFALQRRKIIPPPFLQQLQNCWKRGAMHEILPLCQQSEAPLTRILKAGFRRLELGLLETERAIESAGQHEIALLTAHLRMLGAVGVIAPMLGLLGTVTGMIKAFENIAQSGAGNPNLVASGIAEALTTTAAGLIVAIPSLAAYHFFRARVDRLVYELEEIVTTLLTGFQATQPAAADEENKHAVSQSR
ncbi:MAG: MotA/TolQ/ExbB proton channel family protein [Desulfobacterales bacterium]|nr:MAG: MotA/TolQ/ExbB proton channel family protein [Desulfobacterales bacterium]